MPLDGRLSPEISANMNSVSEAQVPSGSGQIEEDQSGLNASALSADIYDREKIRRSAEGN